MPKLESDLGGERGTLSTFRPEGHRDLPFWIEQETIKRSKTKHTVPVSKFWQNIEFKTEKTCNDYKDFFSFTKNINMGAQSVNHKDSFYIPLTMTLNRNHLLYLFYFRLLWYAFPQAVMRLQLLWPGRSTQKEAGCNSGMFKDKNLVKKFWC
ncbi:hypothetical protein KUTeg_010114 [Tegillarca granosa]|uniref:Uncharacterized protein n=1 Tax=Tegillarca granosa TaxID=220873 RepID=A0ABQ9F5U6_TEGGR|nr:hypothetical protein KUTeg_010114 [Tegillarca granosa]